MFDRARAKRLGRLKAGAQGEIGLPLKHWNLSRVIGKAYGSLESILLKS